MRRFFKTFFPEMFEKMKAESQTWIMHCPNCGQQTSVWDAGGLRYMAKGEPSGAAVVRAAARSPFTRSLARQSKRSTRCNRVAPRPMQTSLKE